MERDPSDYYNDLPNKIPPIPPDIKEKNKLVIFDTFYIHHICLFRPEIYTSFKVLNADQTP